MLSQLPRKEKRSFSAIVFACSDALCTPKHGVREFLLQNGITTIEESMIHSIRLPGGIHNARALGKNATERKILEEAQVTNLKLMVELKKAKIIVIDGHTPCGACNILKISTERQKKILRGYAKRLHKISQLPVIALLEDHEDQQHRFIVIDAFGIETKEVANAA